MYGPLWRVLPGPWPVKALLSLILVVAVVVVCFLWLFPAIAPFMPFNDNAVQTGARFPGPTTAVPYTAVPNTAVPTSAASTSK
jgi:hypothetical protein